MLWSSLTLCRRCLKVLPQEVLLSESGELTDLGRSYVAPRVLLEALSVICSSASQWGDPGEAESLAMEVLLIAHHPSIGTSLGAAPSPLAAQPLVHGDSRPPQWRLALVSGPSCSAP